MFECVCQLSFKSVVSITRPGLTLKQTQTSAHPIWHNVFAILRRCRPASFVCKVLCTHLSANEALSASTNPAIFLEMTPENPRKLEYSSCALVDTIGVEWP
jgi:hypothetical protein